MIFRKRTERALKYSREQAEKRDALSGEKEDLSKELEKGDLLAMLIAGFVVLWPAALVVLAIIAAAGYFFLVR